MIYIVARSERDAEMSATIDTTPPLPRDRWKYVTNPVIQLRNLDDPLDELWLAYGWSDRRDAQEIDHMAQHLEGKGLAVKKVERL